MNVYGVAPPMLKLLTHLRHKIHAHVVIIMRFVYRGVERVRLEVEELEVVRALVPFVLLVVNARAGILEVLIVLLKS